MRTAELEVVDSSVSQELADETRNQFCLTNAHRAQLLASSQQSMLLCDVQEISGEEQSMRLHTSEHVNHRLKRQDIILTRRAHHNFPSHDRQGMQLHASDHIRDLLWRQELISTRGYHRKSPARCGHFAPCLGHLQNVQSCLSLCQAAQQSCDFMDHDPGVSGVIPVASSSANNGATHDSHTCVATDSEDADMVHLLDASGVSRPPSAPPFSDCEVSFYPWLDKLSWSAWNAAGLCASSPSPHFPAKLATLRDLSSRECDVICIQETHCGVDSPSLLGLAFGFKYLVFAFLGLSRSAGGLLICVARRLIDSMTQFFGEAPNVALVTFLPGCASAVTLSVPGFDLRFINIHFPPSAPAHEQQIFLTTVMEHTLSRTRGFCMLCGVFNFVTEAQGRFFVASGLPTSATPDSLATHWQSLAGYLI